ncbi:Sm-like protein LSM1A [Astathelohania contejeani]|uniref:Sm-like protein LSM1A n=1 Tax=Astathelohania contejeani TaxID=164912 RepID=A0ABQ7HZL4_9MICR|nr:Sm-like protein LSM1A [Thelohania contejeani]
MENDLIGTKDLERYLDKDIIILLWDGRYIFGKMRSFDQYNNVTLENCYERIFFNNKYSEIEIGLYIIRGDNIIIIGLANNPTQGLEYTPYDVLKKEMVNNE